MAAAGKPVVLRKRVDVEQIVIWALVDNGLGRGFVDRGGKLDWTDYGGRLDMGSGRGSVALPGLKHEDALRVVGRIQALPAPEMADVVIRHGRTNCRPDWCEDGVGHMEIKTNKRGQVEWHYERPGDTKSRKLEPKRIWVGETAERVEWYRAQYDLWWLSLEALVVPLNEVLVAHQATGPAAPREPWVRYGEGTPLAHAMAGDSARRLAEMDAAGAYELPLSEDYQVNTTVAESASSGGGHGRS